MTTLTVLADGAATHAGDPAAADAAGAPPAVEAVLSDGRVLVDAAALPGLLGWTLKPEGLCRDEVCVPTWDRAAVEPTAGTVDLLGVAAALDRPALVDEASSVLAIGSPRADRRAALAGRRAPDVELPDLQGRRHRLESFFDRRVTLVAFASW